MSRVAGTMVARSPCTSDHLFESEPSPTSAVACGEVTGGVASRQEVGTCSTRSESQGMYNVRLR